MLTILMYLFAILVIIAILDGARETIAKSTNRMALLFPTILGGIVAILGVFPFAVLLALVHPFLIPFSGLSSEPERIVWLVILYGVCFGGFPIVGILGCLCGLYACRVGRGERKRIAFITLGLAIAVAFLAACTMAIIR
jgi:hypothetical protein